MPTLYLDTNVFIDAAFFRPAGAQAFLRVCRFAGISIAVPEVVIDEVHGNYRKRLSSAVVSLTKAERAVGVLTNHAHHAIDVDEECNEYEGFLEELLNELEIERLPYPEVTTQELVTEEYKNCKPFKENGEGHKDFLIWRSLLAKVTSGTGNGPHVFVTSNTADFAAAKTKGAFDLHPDLMEQLDGHDAAILGSTNRQFTLETHVLPLLDGWRPWSQLNLDYDIDHFAERTIGNELPYRTMFGLEGLPFSSDVTITMYGEPTDLVTEYARIADKYMIRISGSSECLFSGFMEKWEYYSEYSESSVSGSDWNDHVVEVEDHAVVKFEILAVFNPEDGTLSGATLKVLNEIQTDAYM